MFTQEQIKKAVKSKGYIYFDSPKNYDVNIIGIRCNNNNKVTNLFDDILVLIYKKDGEIIYKEYPITTDPGVRSLKELQNINGCAILVPGQYRSCYMIGTHKTYKALVQRDNVKVYRDKNKDLKYDLDSKTIQSGLFGINIHKSGKDSNVVDNWSAGCQVFKKEKDFNEFMSIINKSAEIFGNKFTYTLLNKNDIK